MSENKFKYWEVTTTKIVRANNKSEAIDVINRKRTTAGSKVLLSSTAVDRISAAEAHYLVDEMTTASPV